MWQKEIPHEVTPPLYHVQFKRSKHGTAVTIGLHVQVQDFKSLITAQVVCGDGIWPAALVPSVSNVITCLIILVKALEHFNILWKNLTMQR